MDIQTAGGAPEMTRAAGGGGGRLRDGARDQARTGSRVGEVRP